MAVAFFLLAAAAAAADMVGGGAVTLGFMLLVGGFAGMLVRMVCNSFTRVSSFFNSRARRVYLERRSSSSKLSPARSVLM